MNLGSHPLSRQCPCYKGTVVIVASVIPSYMQVNLDYFNCHKELKKWVVAKGGEGLQGGLQGGLQRGLQGVSNGSPRGSPREFSIESPMGSPSGSPKRSRRGL